MAVTTNATGMSGPGSRTATRPGRRGRRTCAAARRTGRQAALELLGEDDVAEAVPGVRACRTRSAPGTVRRAAAARGRRARRSPRAGRRSQHEPAAAPDPGSTARTYSPTGIASSRVSEWLPTASPKTRSRRAGSGRRGRSDVARRAPVVAAATRAVPADQQPEQDRHERQVERMRLGVGRDRPGDRGQGQPDAGRDPEDRAAGQGPDEVDGDAGGDREARPEAGSSGRPARRTAGGGPTPASRGGRRSGSPSGARCPGAGRPPGARRCPRTRRRAASPARPPTRAIDADDDGRREPRASAAHHPSDRLQATPHRLIASDATTRPMARGMPHLRPNGQALEPERDEDQRERRGVVAEAIAELDPALAEVHQVDGARWR